MSSRRGLLLLGVFALGVAAVWSMRGREPAAPIVRAVAVPADAELETRLTAYESETRRLAGELERVHRERAELSQEIAALRDEIGRMQSAPTPRRERRARSRRAAATPPKVAAVPQPAAVQRPFDANALVAAGFPEQTVRSFKESQDQIELDRLYLRDLAAREGWLGTPRFQEAERALADDPRATRAEYGDEFYDWMLFTTGHPNRVQVHEVITGSIAAEVGLRAGDVVLSYAGERVFSPVELRDATSGGTAGESITLDVVRDGRSMRVAVPRGPLGVRVEGVPLEPQRAG